MHAVNLTVKPQPLKKGIIIHFLLTQKYGLRAPLTLLAGHTLKQGHSLYQQTPFFIRQYYLLTREIIFVLQVFAPGNQSRSFMYIR